MLQKADGSWDATVPAHLRPARRRRWPWVALVVLALGAGGGAYLWRSAEAAPPPETVEVVRGDIETNVTAIANIQPKTYVDVGTQVSGQLRTVHVEIGDVVKKGDLLAEIDPTVYQTRVLADRAQLDNLKAQSMQAEAQLVLDRLRDERAQQLLKTQSGSKDTADSSAATVKISEAKILAFQAQIKQTQATLDGDLANLGYTKIYAPADGTVVSQTALEGNTLNANQQAPIILRIADLDTMTVTAQVAEGDIPRISTGMPAYFKTLGLPDRRWEGIVRQTQPTPTVTNDVVLYNVMIDVPNVDRHLMINMTAQVFFQTGAARDVPLVPVAALKASPRGPAGSFNARVLGADGKVEPRRVRIGLSDRTTAEVLEGLKVGDKVVIGGETRGPGRPGMPSMPARL